MDEVQTLDLVGLQAVRALHAWQHGHNLLRQGTKERGSGCGMASKGTFNSLCSLYIHFLSNGGVLLEEKVHVHIKVGQLQAPCHPTNNLQGKSDG